MANKFNTTLYTGVTAELFYRVLEHKEKKYPKSFTAKYNLNKLVYYEVLHSIEEAIARKKQIKEGSRNDKDSLIIENCFVPRDDKPPSVSLVIARGASPEAIPK